MKFRVKIILIFVSCLIISTSHNFCFGICAGENNGLKVETIEQTFKTELKDKKDLYYTKVPRGIIISFPLKYFYPNGEPNLSLQGERILKRLANLIKSTGLPCVIEANYKNKDSLSNLETSIYMAERIAEYLITKQNLNPKSIRSIGFGDMMPFEDNVSYEGHLDERIDFVIIEYSNSR